MVDLSTRLTRAIERILRASENFSRFGVSSEPEGNEPVDESASPATLEPSPLMSNRVLNRLASEGSAARLMSASLSDPNGVPFLPQNNGNGVSGAPGHNKNGAKHAHPTQKQGANGANNVSNAPLSEQEKSELLNILQRLDASYTMADVNYLVNGIASGDITDVSFRSLRRVVEAAREYGIDFVVASLQDDGGSGLPSNAVPAGPPSSATPSSPTPSTPSTPSTPNPVTPTPVTPTPDTSTVTDERVTNPGADEKAPPTNLDGSSQSGSSENDPSTADNATSSAVSPPSDSTPGDDLESEDAQEGPITAESNVSGDSPEPADTQTAPVDSHVVEEELAEVEEELSDVTDTLEDLDAVGEEMAGAQEELGEIKEEVAGVQEELVQVEEELAAVQEELEDVKEVIEEIRQIIFVIRHHIRDFKLSRSLQADTLPHLRMTKNALLTSAFKKETQDTERVDTEKMNARRTADKIDEARESFEQTMVQQQWQSQIVNASEVSGDRRINPEAEVPDVD